jgi:hypothetical protein
MRSSITKLKSFTRILDEGRALCTMFNAETNAKMIVYSIEHYDINASFRVAQKVQPLTLDNFHIIDRIKFETRP